MAVTQVFNLCSCKAPEPQRIIHPYHGSVHMPGLRLVLYPVYINREAQDYNQVRALYKQACKNLNDLLEYLIVSNTGI